MSGPGCAAGRWGTAGCRSAPLGWALRMGSPVQEQSQARRLPAGGPQQAQRCSGGPAVLAGPQARLGRPGPRPARLRPWLAMLPPSAAGSAACMSGIPNPPAVAPACACPAAIRDTPKPVPMGAPPVQALRCSAAAAAERPSLPSCWGSRSRAWLRARLATRGARASPPLLSPAPLSAPSAPPASRVCVCLQAMPIISS